MKEEKGFTLVELLAVIVILAVILVIAVPRITDAIKSTRDASFESSAKMIASQAETEYQTRKTLGEDIEKIECSDVVRLNENDYDYCSISFDNNGVASVTMVGLGKFKDKYICGGTKNGAETTETECMPNLIKASTKIERLSTTTGNNLISDNGIRYVGGNPNNYVYYNCLDEDGNEVAYGENNYAYATSCEVWRIIGVFDVASTIGGPTEKRVKIVRTQSLGSMSWDSSDAAINSGYGVNEWSQSDLQALLNGYYIGKSVDGNAPACKYCNGQNQSSCNQTCSFAALTKTAKGMIADAVWYTGALAWADIQTLSATYQKERGTQTGKICTAGTAICNDTVTREKEWKGKVGLIYPSDYGYASTQTECKTKMRYDNTTCQTNNWLHNGIDYWMLSPSADSSFAYNAVIVYSAGGFSSNRTCYIPGVRPSVYLKSNIRIIGENNGSSSQPFILST